MHIREPLPECELCPVPIRMSVTEGALGVSTVPSGFLFQERQQLVAAGAVLLGGEQFAPRLLSLLPLSGVELVIGVEAFAQRTLPGPV